MTSRTSTPPFLDADGNVLTDSIAEERRVNLGGVEQYVLLRGRSRTAPLLVYVHGGPGGSETPFLRIHNAELENDFLTVYWDQRGTVKSFDARLDPAELTIARMTADLGELIDLLLAEFNQDQVLLVAHSWGTILALEYVAARPETVAAYISISQITNQMANDTESFLWALAEAQARGDAKAIATLETLGPPSYTAKEQMTRDRYLNRLGGIFVEPQSNLDLLWSVLALSEFAWPDFIAFLRGNAFSLEALCPEQQDYDAYKRHPKIEVPIILMLGRSDRVVSPRLGAEYLATLEVPDKELIWFEKSAHMVPFEEPEKFNAAVRQIARQVGLFE
ncbi:MAG: alpha/beta hydrolase [Leptolyngbya sp. SIO1E4]|nr:alpha/beta hydrolase [Leptolyngbya sp. SIO1E4]